MTEGVLSLHHNDKTVLQLGAPDASLYYQFSFAGEGVFRDILFEQSLVAQVTIREN